MKIDLSLLDKMVMFMLSQYFAVPIAFSEPLDLGCKGLFEPDLMRHVHLLDFDGCKEANVR